MRRAALPWFVALVGVAACGARTQAAALGVSGRVVGEPCVPRPEADPMFGSFSEQDLFFEHGNATCGADLVCFVNHFRGRTGCPYGQDCKTPGGQSVTKTVLPQCTDRRPKDAVYCSCRCANAAGKTTDGDSYCACPSGFSCEQLVLPISSDPSVGGAYCVKTGTEWNSRGSCPTACDPKDAPCK